MAFKGGSKDDYICQATGSPQASCPCVFLITRKCLDIKCCTNCGNCILQIPDVCMKSLFSQVTFIPDSVYASSQIFSAALPTLFNGHYCYSFNFKYHQLSHPFPGHRFHGVVIAMPIAAPLPRFDLTRPMEALAYPAGI